MAVPDNQVSVGFPKLRQLTYNHSSGVFVFRPDSIPSHLESVELSVSWNVFCNFSKLMGNSIGTPSAMFTTTPDNVQARYRAADRLFNRIGSCEETQLVFTEISRISMEHA